MPDRRSLACVTAAAMAASCFTLVGTSPTSAAPAPGAEPDDQPRLGLGLQALLDAEASSTRRRALSGFRLNPTELAVRDGRDRVRVSLTPREGSDPATFRQIAEAAGLATTAQDDTLGTVEGFASTSAITQLAALPDTGTLNLSPRAETRQGDATSQGVALQRVDRVQRRGTDGRGITVGILSDSFDTAPATVTGEPLEIRAADDVASGDLPGPGNPRNRQPIVIVEEYDDGTTVDEGRAMAQIVHDVAPGARICFATAFTGLIGFADNVRRLADRRGACRADVIVDDIGYFEEPFFSDSVLADAIRDVTDDGVHYFTAVGNDGDRQSWDGRLRLVSADAADDSGIDLADVPPELYDGGFVDVDPGRDTDIAQDVSIGDGGALFNLQWDDPFDLDGVALGDPFFTAEGDLTEADPEQTFTVSVPDDVAGSTVEFRVDGVPSGSTDVVIALETPEGELIGPVDGTTSPEVITTRAVAGDYQLTVTGFDDATGPFSVSVAEITGSPAIGTDLNLLFFDTEGTYLFALQDENALTGRPQELGFLEGPGDLQVVVSRAGTGRPTATRLRHLLLVDGAMTEHVDPLAPAAYGHVYAPGAVAVAAYDPFRPFLPEWFNSPGGDLPVLFDSNGDRYRKPQLRQVPQIAAADGGNNTFFGIDSARDADDQPNFNGTSAAAPHAAAIAALVLQRDPLSPEQLQRRLERSTFDHDLDPHESVGRAGGVRLKASGTQGSETRSLPPGSMIDDRFFTLSYDGTVPLRSLTLFGETGSPTALGERFGQLSEGIVFDPRPFTGAAPFDEQGFPFTVGDTSGGLRESTVSASYSQEKGEGQFRRMRIDFAQGLRDGQEVAFGIDRDLAVSGVGNASGGNGADELGGAVFLPQGRAMPLGLAFGAVRADGRRIYGVMRNDLGSGFTPLDGYGLVNAEEAVRRR